MPGMPKEKTATDLTGAPDAKLALGTDPRLVAALGPELSARDLEIWAGMPASRRMKALQRIGALDRYFAEAPDVAAKAAAIEAGVTLSRFYQMARAWAVKRSLSNLGTYALVVKPRAGLKPFQISALEAVVGDVIGAKANQTDSIAALARKLGKASNLKPDEVPSKNTLRGFIEREQRRRRDAKLAGTEVLFDLSATSLHRCNGQPHVAFFLIDGGTGLILGHAIGVAEESAAGYRDAAHASLNLILPVLRGRAIWSKEFKRAQMVTGADVPELVTMIARIGGEMDGVCPTLTEEDRQGRYIREHLGLRLSSVRLLPAQTIPDEASAVEIKGVELDTTTAFARTSVAVVEHNAAVLAALDLKGDVNPPDELIKFLNTIAAI